MTAHGRVSTDEAARIGGMEVQLAHLNEFPEYHARLKRMEDEADRAWRRRRDEADR